MSTKSSLKLHEAIAVVLLGKENRTASFAEIAEEINRRALYERKDRAAVPDYQVLQRALLSNGQYHHLFERVTNQCIKLRNI